VLSLEEWVREKKHKDQARRAFKAQASSANAVVTGGLERVYTIVQKSSGLLVDDSNIRRSASEKLIVYIKCRLFVMWKRKIDSLTVVKEFYYNEDDRSIAG
jgi:hypothetical protein